MVKLEIVEGNSEVAKTLWQSVIIILDNGSLNSLSAHTIYWYVRTKCMVLTSEWLLEYFPKLHTKRLAKFWNMKTLLAFLIIKTSV